MEDVSQGIPVPKLKHLMAFYITRDYWEDRPFEAQREALVERREEIIKEIFEIPLKQLPLRLKRFLKECVISLEETYCEFFQWRDAFDELLPPNLLNNGTDYVAHHYFTCEWHFDDVAWVKTFINNTENEIFQRFSWACCYCFESEITMLWRKMRDIPNIPNRVDESEIQNTLRGLIGLWINKLHSEPYELHRRHSSMRRFLYKGFLISISTNCVQALYYFTHHLPEDIKGFFISSHILFQEITTAAENDYHGIVCFLYFELSEEQKLYLFEWTVRRYRRAHVWHCLLMVTFTHDAVLQEILEFPDSTLHITSSLLFLLARSIKHLRLDMLRDAFRKLWLRISEQDKLHLLEDEQILSILVEAEELELVVFSIKRMSEDQKDKCLLHDWIGAGIYNLDTMPVGDCELLHRYLCSFLVHFDSTSHTEIVRESASHVFDTFVHSSKYRDWIKCIHSSKRYEIIRTIETLQGALSAIDDLLKRIK